MFPYLAVSNREIIKGALKENDPELKIVSEKVPISYRVHNIVKAKQREAYDIPFKKDPIYRRYVHTNDKVEQFIESIENKHKKMPREGLWENLFETLHSTEKSRTMQQTDHQKPSKARWKDYRRNQYLQTLRSMPTFKDSKQTLYLEKMAKIAEEDVLPDINARKANLYEQD